MKNSEVARVFRDIADFLEIRGGEPFKVRAYQRVARSIEHLPVSVAQLAQEENLKEVSGIGDAIAKKVTELVTTGHLKYYEDLRSEFPQGLIDLLNIPGIGSKTAIRLAQELGIETVEQLEQAILSGRVAGLDRLGDRTAENILHHIRLMRTKEQRTPLGVALPIAEEMLSILSRCRSLRNLSTAGSLRRLRETVGDIDLMATADDAEAGIQAFVQLPRVEEVLAKGGTKASIVTYDGLQIDLRIVEHDSFGSLLQHFTGSKQHNILLRELGRRKGLKLSEYGIADLHAGVVEKFTVEEDFYRRLGLQFIPPELREGQHEVERAEQDTIPRLVDLSDIKGDTHVHTTWSDGHNSIGEMAVAARVLGYEYLVIADHSMGLGIAHGLSEERLREQVQEVRDLNRQLDGIRVLAGTEVDIRADGTLDFPDDLLSELDVVIAAVHSAMGQDEKKMTQRVIRAISNPHVDILAHPVCRLLGKREPVRIDMESIFHAAAESNTALEINAMPDRLDLNDVHVFRARELGVKLVIGTDAHSVEQLRVMRFGVGVARRGWCETQHILNTRPETGVFLKSVPVLNE